MKDRVDGVCRYRQDTEIFRYKDIYNAKKENNPMRGMEGYMKGTPLRDYYRISSEDHTGGGIVGNAAALVDLAEVAGGEAEAHGAEQK